jgi:hypothetical protein
MRAKSLDDGLYSSWERGLASRYPFALSEMKWPSVPLGRPDTPALARWGIEVHSGWRAIIEQLLDSLEPAIAAQPAERRDRYRIVQMKEKFGSLVVYLAATPTEAMLAAIHAAERASVVTCEVCGALGQLEERRGWHATRCPAHASWSPPWDQLD